MEEVKNRLVAYYQEIFKITNDLTALITDKSDNDEFINDLNQLISKRQTKIDALIKLLTDAESAGLDKKFLQSYLDEVHDIIVQIQAKEINNHEKLHDLMANINKQLSTARGNRNAQIAYQGSQFNSPWFIDKIR